MENFRFLSCIICPNLTASVKWLARKKRNLHPAGSFGLQTRSPQTCLTPKCATVLNLLAPGKTLCKLCRNFGYPGVSLLAIFCSSRSKGAAVARGPKFLSMESVPLEESIQNLIILSLRGPSTVKIWFISD